MEREIDNMSTQVLPSKLRFFPVAIEREIDNMSPELPGQGTVLLRSKIGWKWMDKWVEVCEPQLDGNG
jgi:hypothetical protein